MNHINIFSTLIFIVLISPLLLAQTTCEVEIDDNQSICRGQSVEICVNGADSYHWSTQEQSNCITVSPQETTTYHVNAAKNGCEASGQITIFVSGPINLQTDDDKTICAGKSVEICANGADNYHWNTEEQRDCITVSPHETTTYEVVGSKNGCEATEYMTVNVNDSFTLQIDEDKTTCAGQSVEICADGAEDYYWSNGKNKACIWVSPKNTKTFSVIGVKNSCEAEAQIKVKVDDSFSLQTTNDQTICAGKSVEICAEGADNYWWGDGVDKRCITVSPHETTTYQVFGNKNGCEAAEQITVFVEDSLNANCSESKLGLTDTTGEWYLEHKDQTHTKFYIGNDEKMIIQNNGKVGIGTDTAIYKLDVCGTIRAVEVLVEDDWCDYVFDENYTLPSLEDEKEHIETNGYLLGFESEEAMSGKISLQKH